MKKVQVTSEPGGIRPAALLDGVSGRCGGREIKQENVRSLLAKVDCGSPNAADVTNDQQARLRLQESPQTLIRDRAIINHDTNGPLVNLANRVLHPLACLLGADSNRCGGTVSDCVTAPPLLG